MAQTEFYVTNDAGADMRNAGSTEGAHLVEYVGGSYNSSTNVFTPASGNPVTAGVTVGMFASMFADGATSTTFVARVTAVSSTTITLSSTATGGTGTEPATGSGLTMRVGGAWSSPSWPLASLQGTATNSAFDITRCNIKGTHVITAAISRVIGGPVVFEGYSATPGDGGKATLQGSAVGSSFTVFTANNASARNATFRRLIFDGNGDTGASFGVILGDGRYIIEDCVICNMRGDGLQISSSDITVCNVEIYNCNISNAATGSGLRLSAAAVVRDCFIHDNPGSNTAGILVGQDATIKDCVIDNNGRFGIQINTGTATLYVDNCDIHRNGDNGIHNSGATNIFIENCNLIRNDGYGIQNTGRLNGYIRNCGFFGNVSGETALTNETPQLINNVTYAADPYEGAGLGVNSEHSVTAGAANPRGGNFTPTALSGARAGATRTFIQDGAEYNSTSTTYRNRGAIQHQDSGGGGGGGSLPPIGSGLIVARSL